MTDWMSSTEIISMIYVLANLKQSQEIHGMKLLVRWPIHCIAFKTLDQDVKSSMLILNCIHSHLNCMHGHSMHDN